MDTELTVDPKQLVQDESALGLQSLFFFDKYILGYKEMVEPLHRDMTTFVSTNKHRNKLCLLPRGSFKSSCITVGMSVQEVTSDPNIRILIASETYANAQKFLREIKGHFVGNTNFKDHYGDFMAEVGWTETEITVSRRTKNFKEPTITTAGLDVTKVGMHYDRIIIDDPVSQSNVTNNDQIEKTLEWWKLLFSLLEPTGRMIVIGTRWHYDDLYGYIIENEQDHFDVLHRQAIQADGTLLFPERLTHEFLETQRKRQGSYIFSSQYQNTPILDEDAVLKGVQKYFPENLMGRKLYKFMMIDPAVSEKESADYTAFVVVGVDEEKNWWVLDAIHKRCLPGELIDTAFSLYTLHRPLIVGVEVQAFQKVLVYIFNQEMVKRQIHLPIREVKADTDKFRRVLNLQPRVEEGKLFIRNDHADLEQEMRRFPRGKHDDLIDALASLDQLVYYPQPERRTPVYVPENDVTGY
jgi:predicted phage terminase large subunit-like protein